MALGEAFKGFSQGFRTGLTGESRAQQEAEQANLQILQDKQEMVRTQLSNALDIQDMNRMSAMAIDTRKANVILESGDFNALEQLLQNRAKTIKKQGKDSKQTDDWLNDVRATKQGDQEAFNRLGGTLATAELSFVAGALLSPRTQDQMRYMGKAARPERIKSSEISEEGQSFSVDPATGKIVAEDVAGFKKPENTKKLEQEVKALNNKFEQSKAIRSEIDKISKGFSGIEDAYGRIEVSAKDPSAAGDLALIFNYMKMLDPGSTVREGEFATAAEAGSVGSRVYGLYNKIIAGERLAPDQRTDFLSRSKKLYEKAEKTNKSRIDQRLNVGKRYNLSRVDILGEELIPEKTESLGGMKTVTSQVEFDALPSGAIYLEDGKEYRKP